MNLVCVLLSLSVNYPHIQLRQSFAKPRFAALYLIAPLSNLIPSLSQNDLIRGLLEKYPTFGREKETGLLGALDT